jgi:hypothetical protein
MFVCVCVCVCVCITYVHIYIHIYRQLAGAASNGGINRSRAGHKGLARQCRSTVAGPRKVLAH